MSFTGLPQEFPAYVAALEQRIRALESRTVSSTGGAHSHNGSGTNSTIVAGQADAVAPVASGERSTAGGDGAIASADRATAYGAVSNALAVGTFVGGFGAYADQVGGVSVGAADGLGAGSPTVEAPEGVSIGTAAHVNTGHDASVALGYFSNSTGSYQIQLGSGWGTGGRAGIAPHRALIGAPNTAIADADLVDGQISFYLDEGGNTLTVKVKYSTGTVKTGTVALV